MKMTLTQVQIHINGITIKAATAEIDAEAIEITGRPLIFEGMPEFVPFEKKQGVPPGIVVEKTDPQSGKKYEHRITVKQDTAPKAKKSCTECGAEFLPASGAQKRCDDCRFTTTKQIAEQVNKDIQLMKKHTEAVREAALDQKEKTHTPDDIDRRTGKLKSDFE